MDVSQGSRMHSCIVDDVSRRSTYTTLLPVLDTNKPLPETRHLTAVGSAVERAGRMISRLTICSCSAKSVYHSTDRTAAISTEAYRPTAPRGMDLTTYIYFPSRLSLGPW